MSHAFQSAIKDNQGRSRVGDFLKDCLKDGSRLSFVSAYFTIAPTPEKHAPIAALVEQILAAKKSPPSLPLQKGGTGVWTFHHLINHDKS